MIRKNPTASIVTAAVVAVGTATTGLAQGIPVFDITALTQQIEQLAQLKSQLDTMNQQLTQAQQLYGSLNKITNMGDIARLLNDPSIRKALPADFASVEQLMSGQGTGAAGASAAQFQAGNSVYSLPGNDFYSSELKRLGRQNAGAMSIGQQMYDAATQRIEGIDQLRQQIGQSPDPKTTMDLQARLQAEIAFLQTDTLRMQGLRMVQQAQLEVVKQRSEEDWRRRVDTMGTASPGTPSQ